MCFFRHCAELKALADPHNEDPIFSSSFCRRADKRFLRTRKKFVSTVHIRPSHKAVDSSSSNSDGDEVSKVKVTNSGPTLVSRTERRRAEGEEQQEEEEVERLTFDGNSIFTA